jgi:hypothetical protein
VLKFGLPVATHGYCASIWIFAACPDLRWMLYAYQPTPPPASSFRRTCATGRAAKSLVSRAGFPQYAWQGLMHASDEACELLQADTDVNISFRRTKKML